MLKKISLSLLIITLFTLSGCGKSQNIESNTIPSKTSLKDVVKKTLDEVGYNNLSQDIKITVTGDPDTLNISWFTKEKLDIKKVNIDE